MCFWKHSPTRSTLNSLWDVSVSRNLSVGSWGWNINAGLDTWRKKHGLGGARSPAVFPDTTGTGWVSYTGNQSMLLGINHSVWAHLSRKKEASEVWIMQQSTWLQDIHPWCALSVSSLALCKGLAHQRGKLYPALPGQRAMECPSPAGTISLSVLLNSS